MKNSILVLFPIVFFFFSCQNTSEKTVDEFIDHQISLTEEMRGNDRLAEIPPNDIWIMNTSIQKNLNEMDQWYKDELLQFSNDAYFDNLKSISISIILQQDEIRNVENINLLKYYLEEEVSLGKIANLDVVLDVLEFLKHNDISSEAFVATLAKKKSESFMQYKDANGIKEFLQKNEASIKKLNSLQYDRWGNDLSNK